MDDVFFFLFCRFGEPIDVDQYTPELFKEGVSHADAAKSVVKKLNAELERRLLALTINAPDWCVISHHSREKDLTSTQGDILCCSDGNEDTLGRRRGRPSGIFCQGYAKV
jgi:hypothetical protein